MLLQNPRTGQVVDVTGPRATTLRARGFVAVAEDEAAAARKNQSAAPGPPSAVQPQPPIDARPNPPEPPTDTRPDDLVTSPPIDTRPPNPLGPTSDSVAEADGAGLDNHSDEPSGDDRPAQSASKAEWVTYAEANGIDDADSYTKQQLIDELT